MNTYIQQISDSSIALILHIDQSASEHLYEGLKKFSEQINKPILLLENHDLTELNEGDLAKFGLKRLDPEQFECPCPECASQH